MATRTISNTFHWDDHAFWLMPEGKIVCDTCSGETWCTHMEKMTTSNADAEFIWNLGDQMFRLQIPMFPTAGLWATCVLVWDSALDTYKVKYEHREDSEGYFLGYLHPGEGRNVIRSMILDWFQGLPNQMKCKSSSHKVTQQMQWDAAMKQHSKRLLNLWSVWANNVCVPCNDALGDMDDLIPDGSSTRRNVF